MDILVLLFGSFLLITGVMAPLVIGIALLRRVFVFTDDSVKWMVLGFSVLTIRYDAIAWIRKGSKPMIIKKGGSDWNPKKGVSIGLKEIKRGTDRFVLAVKDQIAFFETLKQKLEGKGVDIIET